MIKKARAERQEVYPSYYTIRYAAELLGISRQALIGQLMRGTYEGIGVIVDDGKGGMRAVAVNSLVHDHLVARRKQAVADAAERAAA